MYTEIPEDCEYPTATTPKSKMERVYTQISLLLGSAKERATGVYPEIPEDCELLQATTPNSKME